MKQPVRSFSIGLLTAGISLLIIFYFFNDTTKEQIAVDDMISMIEDDGYHVLTESEFISVSVDQEENDEKGEPIKTDSKPVNNEDEKNKPNEDGPKEETRSYTLTIESGMAPSTISGLLVENNIIDNEAEFNQYFEENEYSQKVQIGEFQLSSDMSNADIAETITQ